MNLIAACEESGKVRDAFIRKGHNAWSCDLLPGRGEFPEKHIQNDVLNILDDGWDAMIAHPDCTRMTNAGVRWLHVPPKDKTLDQLWAELYEGIEFYKKLRNAPIPKICLENPIWHKYSRWMLNSPERQIVQPWWFGDEAFKATGFELINLPPLVATNKLIPPKKGTEEHKKWSMIHRMSPGPDRAQLRSETFQGIANAMAEQWG